MKPINIMQISPKSSVLLVVAASVLVWNSTARLEPVTSFEQVNGIGAAIRGVRKLSDVVGSDTRDTLSGSKPVLLGWYGAIYGRPIPNDVLSDLLAIPNIDAVTLYTAIAFAATTGDDPDEFALNPDLEEQGYLASIEEVQDSMSFLVSLYGDANEAGLFADVENAAESLIEVMDSVGAVGIELNVERASFDWQSDDPPGSGDYPFATQWCEIFRIVKEERDGVVAMSPYAGTNGIYKVLIDQCGDDIDYVAYQLYASGSDEQQGALDEAIDLYGEKVLIGWATNGGELSEDEPEPRRGTVSDEQALQLWEDNRERVSGVCIWSWEHSQLEDDGDSFSLETAFVESVST